MSSPVRVRKIDKVIVIEFNKKKIFLDCRSFRKATPDLIFISHAHSDHLLNSSLNFRVISSEETKFMVLAKGKKYNFIDDLNSYKNEFELIKVNHILGSRALFVKSDGGLLYTGDINDKGLFEVGVSNLPKVSILLIEATYGLPRFSFSSPKDTLKEAKDLILDLLRKGKSLFILGYPLGKSQHLQLFFDKYFINFDNYVYPSISLYNDIYSIFNYKILPKIQINLNSLTNLINGKPSVIYLPLHLAKNKIVQNFRKHNFSLVAFSGWALESSFKESIQVDYAFPVSDHADYFGLINIVKQVDPEIVYVTHGFVDSFSASLRKEGFMAYPL
ncbi:MAG: hypothetical protein QXS21_01145 [Thermoproteota archaeon]|nr:hypothetical protein [Candidatus Brockarchaeota archaeon]MBO3763345.1 hypothetical protein [Candidatus Brockarchaeota archaeon]MBO3768051.1 hypothetical protein [Candidatus Brockarchaeota archaeon]MBO3801017.1 hypothetical protein [Candidatus Brockarchaeota archaeon]